MEQRAAINREARARAEEIIAIVHDSAARQAFSPGDATAVMAALHAIRWARAIRRHRSRNRASNRSERSRCR